MPDVSTGTVTDKLRKALDAQGRVAEAARAAARQAAQDRAPAEPEPPAQDRKR